MPRTPDAVATAFAVLAIALSIGIATILIAGIAGCHRPEPADPAATISTIAGGTADALYTAIQLQAALDPTSIPPDALTAARDAHTLAATTTDPLTRALATLELARIKKQYCPVLHPDAADPPATAPTPETTP